MNVTLTAGIFLTVLSLTAAQEPDRFVSSPHMRQDRPSFGKSRHDPAAVLQELKKNDPDAYLRLEKLRRTNPDAFRRAMRDLLEPPLPPEEVNEVRRLTGHAQRGDDNAKKMLYEKLSTQFQVRIAQTERRIAEHESRLTLYLKLLDDLKQNRDQNITKIIDALMSQDVQKNRSLEKKSPPRGRASGKRGFFMKRNLTDSAGHRFPESDSMNHENDAFEDFHELTQNARGGDQTAKKILLEKVTAQFDLRIQEAESLTVDQTRRLKRYKEMLDELKMQRQEKISQIMRTLLLQNYMRKNSHPKSIDPVVEESDDNTE